MIQLIVPRNHIVVFSKLVKTSPLPSFSGAGGEMFNLGMVSFCTVQALKKKIKDADEVQLQTLIIH